ncbi:MAG: Gfo/Idh/MocA family oxidoreductase [Clostridia bacterium]|nr:Gfo/Idh/MocA family oxidoreductase [Clostridia bacterium]
MIRLGIFGLSRGWWYAILMQKANVELVAICDVDQERIDKCKELLAPGGRAYTDFDEFIEHDGLDAVLLCNYFDQHVKFAVKCFERGIHVLSETTSSSTMAESVLLCRQWEKYNKINGVKYMLAENYPFMKCNQELKYLYESGRLGRVMYAEGEYNHPAPKEFTNMITPSMYHWRAWLPATYYNTHALGPVMFITGLTPVSVTAQTISVTDKAERCGGPVRRVCESGAIMLCKMNNGAVARVQGCTGYAAEGNHYLIAGEFGTAESVRGDQDRINLRYNSWQRPEGESDRIYDAQWHLDDELDASLCEGYGHGGSDFWMVREFVNCIQKDREPYFNVYRATAMASVAILGWRSVLEGKTYEIPDMSKEEDRVLWENDNSTPFPDENGEGATVPCSLDPYEPTAEDIAEAERVWAKNQAAKLG